MLDAVPIVIAALTIGYRGPAGNGMYSLLEIFRSQYSSL